MPRASEASSSRRNHEAQAGTGSNNDGLRSSRSASIDPTTAHPGSSLDTRQVQDGGSRARPSASSKSIAGDLREDPKGSRETRKEYRSLIGIQQGKRNNLTETTNEDLHEILQQSGKLYEQVKTAKDSVLDSQLLMATSEMGAQMAKGLKVGSSFDLDDYLACLGRRLGGEVLPVRDTGDEDEIMADAEHWKWDEVGRSAAARSRRAVTMDHLLGPLKIEHVARTRERKTDLDRSAPVTKPQELKEEDIARTTNETSSLVKTIGSILENEGGESGVNYFRFVIDPNSFANTVENIFYVSFLIKEGRAALIGEEEADEDRPLESTEWPILMSCEEPDEEQAQTMQRRQIIMEFDMKTWRDLIEAYDIRKPFLPPRTEVQSDTWERRKT